ncbi:MAG: hypothetical protein JWP74_2644 [Marmoricola sp.]|nr:hypothetical protein [Marmoricola sp.]
MSRVALLLSKDPTIDRGGDVTMSRLLMDLLGEQHDVIALCLSTQASTLPHAEGLTRVQKTLAKGVGTVLGAVVRGQSLVHARFNSTGLRDAIEDTEADVFIAEHSYIAEPYLRSKRAGSSQLFVNTHISESLVWQSSTNALARLEGRRIQRDQLRVARAAHAVATFDAEEAAAYRAAGVRHVRWLDITLPPTEPIPVADSPPRLVFLGERSWGPNQQAADLLRSWWPEIADGIPGAELAIVGAAAPGEQVSSRPGITELGFVDDLDATLGSCRALLAPITTGGGVRVKILDAAARGLPVVSTRAGIGSLSDLFGITPYDDRAAFIARSRALLTDVGAAAAEGTRLHEANAAHWRARGPQRSVDEWLAS